MNLQGKNYTLKCESQKKATKCLVGGGGRGGVKVLATIQCLAIKKKICRHGHILNQCAWMKTHIWA